MAWIFLKIMDFQFTFVTRKRNIESTTSDVMQQQRNWCEETKKLILKKEIEVNKQRNWCQKQCNHGVLNIHLKYS